MKRHGIKGRRKGEERRSASPEGAGSDGFMPWLSLCFTALRTCYPLLDNSKHSIKVVLAWCINKFSNCKGFCALLGGRKWGPAGALTCSPGRGVWRRLRGHSTGHRPGVCSPWCPAGCCPCPAPAVTGHSLPSLQQQPSAVGSWGTTGKQYKGQSTDMAQVA